VNAAVTRTRIAAPTIPRALVPTPRIFETEHYTIESTATASQTRAQADAVESLFSAYAKFFGGMLGSQASMAKLQLVLYQDRQEFRAHSQASSWAEAYYLAPTCYAYLSEGQPNPYHWMIHEATHQLNNEVAHFRIEKWINEGLASYFATSTIDADGLHPGHIDFHTYPIWWLSRLPLSGDMDRDIQAGRFIPLQTIVSGSGGPEFDRNVNLYYIEYWSLSHFLFHYRNGYYAARYRKLIVEGGSPEGFGKIVGPMDRVQGEWYGYLQERIAEAKTQRGK
jgi:hypothetical protein